MASKRRNMFYENKKQKTTEIEGLRLNSDGYVELLNTVVKPWIRRLANGRPYVWQQDSAPCHISGKMQKWLSENFYDFAIPNVWPPNSPDLNPMDYFVWGAFEKYTNRTPISCSAMQKRGKFWIPTFELTGPNRRFGLLRYLQARRFKLSIENKLKCHCPSSPERKDFDTAEYKR
ncbi:hypothetical protein AAG570_012989 [Ranatra chinensis]|uniref:Transposase n=1 Tax=Ranatra chinensis TaxID=642074 RepID=A0ABD0YFG5_9HEMI